MKLVQTMLTETAVRMRYADHADPAQAKEWIDFQWKLADLKDHGNRSLGDPELLYLAELHRAALLQVRDAASAEIQRISKKADRIV